MGSVRAGWSPTCRRGGLWEVLTFSEPQFLLLGKEKRTELAILCDLKETVNIKQSASYKWLSLQSSSQDILDPLGTNYTFDAGLAWATDATLSQEK